MKDKQRVQRKHDEREKRKRRDIKKKRNMRFLKKKTKRRKTKGMAQKVFFWCEQQKEKQEREKDVK